jgi:Family of unknown function (DUF5670)
MGKAFMGRSDVNDRRRCAVSGRHLIQEMAHCLPIVVAEVAMLWTLLVLVLLVWVIGFLFDVAGGLIHLLLLVALGIFLVNIFSARRRTS